MASGKKVIVRSAGGKAAATGSVVQILPDWCLITDAAARRSVDLFDETATVWDKNKVVVILDHDTPSGSEAVSVIQRKLINFAKAQDTIFHQGEGVGYQLLLDHYVQPAQTVLGCGDHMAVFGAVGALGVKVEPEELAEAMKHGVFSLQAPETVTIALTGEMRPGVQAKDVILSIIREQGTKRLAGKMVEFAGPAVQGLTLNDRITICNLAGKMNVFSAVFDLETAETTDAVAVQFGYDLGQVTPQIALPGGFENIVAVGDLERIRVNEVFVGGCSGGRIEDLRVAAGIVRGGKVAKGVRMIVAPITSEVYVQALQEGLITDLIDAGAVVMNQGCSVCWGKSQGIVDTEEVLLSSGSYNYAGCAGAATAKVYVVSAATAATSAMTGFISSLNVG